MGVEAVPRPAPQAGPTLPAHRAPVQDHVVTGCHLLDPGAHRFHYPGGFVAEEEGELVVDPTLAVVQVGMADTARLDADHRFTGTGVGDDDLGAFHGGVFTAGDDAWDRLEHRHLLDCGVGSRSTLAQR